MRVLVLHSRYRSGPASGENRVVEDEIRLLREAGHQVQAWTPSPPNDAGGMHLVGTGFGAVWSEGAVARVGGLVRRYRIEVVHVHNLFPMLSPAVIRAAATEGAKVVATLHNYRLMCLPATLLRDGRICEDCVGRAPWPGVVHRCYRSSSGGSAALATSLTLHRALGTFRRVARYLAVSEFVRAKHVEAGFEPDAITVKPNFAWPVPPRGGPGRHFLYLGRLAPEKGLEVLLRAWGDVPAPLLIAGDGPTRRRLETMAPAGVTFLGLVEPGRTDALLREARALVVPSTSYEGAPRAIPEAYAAGVPVIASRLGGLPEFVADGVSGVLVPPGDVGSLRAAAVRLTEDDESIRLGTGAHRLWADRLGPDQALRALEDAYAGVTGGSRPRP